MDADRWPRTSKVIEAAEAARQGPSPLAILASIPGAGITELRPGVYFGGDIDGARAMLAEHDELLSRMATED